MAARFGLCFRKPITSTQVTHILDELVGKNPWLNLCMRDCRETNYSVVIGFGAMVVGVQQFDIYRVFSYCFPVVTEHYWFATSYVILCLMMPFLNVGIDCLDEKVIRYSLIGFLLIFSISKTAIPMKLPWDKFGYDCIWFVILYLTGAYLRKYGIFWQKSLCKY